MRLPLKGIFLSIMLASAAPSFGAAERHIILDDCVVSGCNNELCTDAKASPVASNCAVSSQSICYATYGECKRQLDSKCGWTPSIALAACVAHPPIEPGSTPPK